MKKKFITFLSLFLLTIGVVEAQSVADGVKDLYAQRYKSARSSFEKLLAANPNDIAATYWLGQTFIEMNDVPAAKALYEKALLASANAPLVIVGMGQVELIENKINEARQRFEAAITMTAGKKGNDPEILNAVGRAITNVYSDREKKGDINFAVTKLQEAADLKPKDNQLLADIYVNLGNAQRKARPGEGGSEAYQSYQKAIEAKPDFALAYWRLASIFNTQRNFSQYQQFLETAVEKDSRFAPAYYDLYYLKLGMQDFNNAEYYAKLYIQNSDPDPQNDYLRVQTLYAKKEYDQAIAGAKNIVAQAGAATRARVYRLLAYSYVEKGDTASAREYIDNFFAKAKDEDINPKDYTLKATIYSVIPGQETEVLNSYIEGIKADTTLDNRIDLAKDAIKFFETKKKYAEAAQIYDTLFSFKPAAEASLNELFGATLDNYRDSSYAKSREFALQMITKAPDQQFGWEWAFRNALIIDTVKKDSIMLPDAMNLLDFAKTDTVKFKKLYIDAASYLVGYYANDVKDFKKAADYVRKMLSIDPTNPRSESWKNTLDQIEKAMKPKSSANKDLNR